MPVSKREGHDYMNQSIGLKTVCELLGKNFFIPSYQRGFRWETQQVEDLLLDIDSFARKQDSKGFYCLQPIVVKLCDEATKSANNLSSLLDDNKWYEVVDGQQRLTTLKILISYLVRKELKGESLEKEYEKSEFRIQYETRPDSSSFLDAIEDSVEPVDFFFISNAYNCIQSWFDTPGRRKPVREYIFKTLISSIGDNNPYGTVQVIWYELEEGEHPIDSFIRINMGKIPLNNAELVKALFLQKRQNEGTDFDRILIANEWDRMEYALQNEDFWGFLNREKQKKPARIEFLFDLMCEFEKTENPVLEKEIGTDDYATFRYFNREFTNGANKSLILAEWEKVREYYSAVEDWFLDPIWYHYIGFLVYCGKSVKDIYRLYKGQKKDDFTDALKEKIKEQFKDVECSKKFSSPDTVEYEIGLIYKQQNVKKFLLLFNIQYLVNLYERAQEKGNEEIFIRFPFQLFIGTDGRKGWDVEHISSQTENRLVDNNSQVEWLTLAIEELKILKTTVPYGSLKANEKSINKIQPQFSERWDNCLNEIQMFLEKSNSALQFPALFKIVTELVGEDLNDNEMLDSIGNLTLLDTKTNRSYGNSLFTIKRKIIIGLDAKGEFLPLCTKNVFLKNFDVRGVSPNKWTEKDMRDHQNSMGKTLDAFLTFKDGVEHV